MFQIGEEVQELKKCVYLNKEVLILLRGSLGEHEEMQKLAAQLKDVMPFLKVGYS